MALLAAVAAPTSAATDSRPNASALPELWGVAANGSFRSTTFARVHRRGINTVVIDSRRLRSRQVRRLRRSAERARLRVLTPTFRGRQENVDDAREACNDYRGAHPGSPCALWESSLSSALTLAQSGSVDLVVVPLSSPGALHALARAPTGRILAIAPLRRTHFRAKAWRRAIKEASSSANLDLGLAPRSARQETISKFLKVLVRSGATSTDRRAPTPPGRLTITQETQTTLALSWKASYDSRGVVGYGVYENNVLVDSSPSTRFTFSALSCGTFYDLAVDAYDLSGRRSPRTSTRRQTLPCPVPAPPPSGASATAASSGAPATTSSGAPATTASATTASGRLRPRRRSSTTRSPSHGLRSTTRSTGATAERSRTSN